MRVSYFLQSVAACGLIYAMPAFAQSTPEAASGAQLDDIVVTARKQSESLITVPVAVTAIAQGDLRKAAADDLTKITQFSPQVLVSRGSYGLNVAIRGIGSSIRDPGIDQTVSINIDGVQVNRSYLALAGVFDLAQVEVLKGPQALFFGKNSPAGVISLISAAPTKQLSGYVSAGYEFVARERYVEGAISGPITSTLGARLAVRGTNMDGWVKNLAPPMANPYAAAYPLPGAWSKRLPGKKEAAARLTLAWNPVDNFDMTFKGFITHYDNNDATNANQTVCAPGTPVSSSGLVDPYADCKLDNRTSLTAPPAAFAASFPHGKSEPKHTINAKIASLVANYDVGDVKLTSVTGYYTLHSDAFGGTFDGTANGRIFAYNGERTNTFTQEFRAISRFDFPVNFTVGAYYDHSKRLQTNEAMLLYAGPDPATGKFDTTESAGRNRSEAYSLFGQLRWAILDTVELAGGARWTHEKKTISLGNTYVHSLAAASFRSPLLAPLQGRYSDSDVSPEATLTWHPTPDSTLYTAYRTGYKSGGFSNGMPVGPATSATTLAFKPETAKGGEIGYKARLFDRKVRVELTAYRYDYSGLQLSSFDVATLSYFIRNAAKARTQGIEASADWKVTPELTLKFNSGYSKARYRSYTSSPCYAGQTAAQGCTPNPLGVRQQDLSGRPLLRAPKWNLTGSFDYSVPINDDLKLSFNGDAYYSTSYFVMETEPELSRIHAYWRLGAGARLSSERNGWELALIGRNLTNKYVGISAVDKPGGPAGTLLFASNRGREMHVQATFRY